MLSFLQFISESVDLDTSENDKEITLHKIVVDKDSRSQGLGSSAMRELTQNADAKGKRIVLTPDASFGGSLSRLKKFYKAHGFKENKGRTRDFTTQHSMIREPRL